MHTDDDQFVALEYLESVAKFHSLTPTSKYRSKHV